MQDVRGRIQQLIPSLVELRHTLHAYPELGFEEYSTAERVTEWLLRHGVEVRTGIAGTGVVGTLRGDAGEGPVIGFRADMDALPIVEQNDLPYRSRNAGKMHACGHDGHTTILLGAAAVLTQLRERLRGTVRFYFQPSEENVSGAKAMIGEGVLDDMVPQWVVALHGKPGAPLGSISLRKGAIMASADTFDVRLTGRGGHAAMPHLTEDPVLAGAQLVQSFQLLASRESAPDNPIVISVTRFHAGTAYNVLPHTAHLAGTVRCLKKTTRQHISERMSELTRSVATAWNLQAQFEWHAGAPCTWNDPQVTDLVARVAQQAFGQDKVIWMEAPLMGAEDFAYFAQRVPAVMFFLGLGDTADLHTACFDFSDAAVAPGVEMFVRLALEGLVPREVD